MDARYWDQHNTSFLEIGGAAIIPVGDRINTHVAAGAETFEIFRQGKYLVIEGETGDHRIRVGTLDRRAVTVDVGTDVFTTASPHPYETGDGPLRIDASVKMTGGPLVTFDQIGAANDKLVRATGSWVTDGFGAGTVVISGAAIGGNNGTFTVVAISTTTNPNDTLEFAGDVFTDSASNAGVRVVQGVEMAGALPGVDYWLIKVGASTFRLATSPLNAVLGVAVDVTVAGSNWEIGGNQGAAQRVGFDPSTQVTSTDGESNKLLRAAEQVVCSAKSVTIRALQAGDVLKWWSVG